MPSVVWWTQPQRLRPRSPSQIRSVAAKIRPGFSGIHLFLYVVISVVVARVLVMVVAMVNGMVSLVVTAFGKRRLWNARWQ